MYKIEISSAVKKDIKNLPKNIQKKIDDAFALLSSNPQVGVGLSGEFNDYFSYHFKVSKVEYRIIYKIYESELVVLVVLVGTRENIYKQLKRRV